MAANPRKLRPNEIEIALSDGSSYSVKDTKRTRGRHKGMIVGYARTSIMDQAAGLAAQERDLMAASAERIFGEQLQRRQAGPGTQLGRAAAVREVQGKSLPAHELGGAVVRVALIR